MSINYTRLKAYLRDRGYSVTEGVDWNSQDLVAYDNYWKDYNSRNTPVVTYDQHYLLTFDHILPNVAPEMAAAISSGQFYNASLWRIATKADGTMYVGTGDSADGFQISNGELVQVALGIRYRHGNQLVPSVEGTLTFNTTDGNPLHVWEVAYSITADPASKLSDYSITLTMTLDSTGASEPTLVVTYNPIANTWVIPGVGNAIVDDEGVANQITQNIEPSTIFSPFVLPTSMQSEPVPYGKYSMTLAAVSPTDQASIQINLNITPTP